MRPPPQPWRARPRCTWGRAGRRLGQVALRCASLQPAWPSLGPPHEHRACPPPRGELERVQQGVTAAPVPWQPVLEAGSLRLHLSSAWKTTCASLTLADSSSRSRNLNAMTQQAHGQAASCRLLPGPRAARPRGGRCSAAQEPGPSARDPAPPTARTGRKPWPASRPAGNRARSGASAARPSSSRRAGSRPPRATPPSRWRSVRTGGTPP